MGLLVLLVRIVADAGGDVVSEGGRLSGYGSDRHGRHYLAYFSLTYAPSAIKSTNFIATSPRGRTMVIVVLLF